MMNGGDVVIVEAVRTPIGRGQPREGLLPGRPPERAARTLLHRGDRARRHRPRARRGRDRRLRPAVRRAGLEHRPQRVAAGRASGRDAGDDARPPVRLGPAGRQLRRRPRSPPASTTSSSARASSTWATIPMFVGRKFVDEVGSPWTPELLARYDLVDQGTSAELIADKWDVPREELDEIGAALAPARGAGDRRGALRARDRPDRGQRRHATRPTRASAATRAWRRSPHSSRRSGRTARSPPATPRRSRTAPPRCC